MTHEQLAQALAEANLELKNPHKDAKADTGSYGYRYATLDAITELVRPILASHGLSVLQDAKIVDDRLAVTTTLLHSSGESITFGPLEGPTGNSWQQLGGGISYARRYQLLSCLGLAAGDDDDATELEKVIKVERVQGRTEDAWTTAKPKVKERPGAVGRSAEGITEPQRKLLGALVREAGFTDSRAFIESDKPEELLGHKLSSPMSRLDASKLIEALKDAKGASDE